MPRSGAPTRRKILDAAEAVLAEVGVDAATFAEINARAGQRNNSATQYHFGDRVGLLEAVVERHFTDIAAHRTKLLADLGPDASMFDIVHALIDPVAACLDDESGRRYLIIQASLLSHPDRDTWPDQLSRPWTRPGVDEIAERVEDSRVIPQPSTELADLKREMLAILLFHSLANRARDAAPRIEDGLFIDALAVALVALINADLTNGAPA